MAVTLVGLVYYADDPEEKIFRKVFPTSDDSELDNPRWTTENVDRERVAVLEKVPLEQGYAAPMTGTP